MKITGMIVLPVCLTFMLLGSTKAQSPTTACTSCANETNANTTTNNMESTGTTQPPESTPLPGHTSAHATSNSNTSSAVTTSPPTDSTTLNSTAATTSSQKATVSSGATQSPATNASGVQNSTFGYDGSKAPGTSATTLKGRSASLLGCYSPFLISALFILILSA